MVSMSNFISCDRNSDKIHGTISGQARKQFCYSDKAITTQPDYFFYFGCPDVSLNAVFPFEILHSTIFNNKLPNHSNIGDGCCFFTVVISVYLLNPLFFVIVH